MKIHIINDRLKKKATQSNGTYKIAAAAFTKHGNLLGMSTNSKNLIFPSSRRGGGIHAERQLMKRYGASISYIILARVGRPGDENLPIHPCEVCAKLAKQLNIKIIPIHEVLGINQQREIKK